MPRPIRSKAFERETLWRSDRPRFKVDQIKVEHEFADGKLRERSYYSFERVDAVAALIVNRDTGMVMLVDQYRAPVAGKDTDGVLTEAPAGMVDRGEDWEGALKREVEEETGYVLGIDRATGKLKDCELIADFFPSPGGSSERIRLYYVTVDSNTPRKKGGGLPEEEESVEPTTMPVDDLIKALDDGKLRDGKTIIAALWLKSRMINRPIEWRLTTSKPGHCEDFSIKGLAGRSIGYFCGDINEVKDVDVWVNSENTNFFMDQFGGPSLSARVRTLGASFDRDDNLIEDPVQEALKSRLAIGSGVKLGQVIDTVSGGLGKPPHNVGRIIHAAVVSYETNKVGVRRPVSTIQIAKECLENALRQFDSLAPPRFGNPFSSMIVPLLGTGQAGVDREEFVAEFLDIAIDYLSSTPHSRLKRLYLLAYSALEIEICDRVMCRHPLLERLKKDSTGSSKG